MNQCCPTCVNVHACISGTGKGPAPPRGVGAATWRGALVVFRSSGPRQSGAPRARRVQPFCAGAGAVRPTPSATAGRAVQIDVLTSLLMHAAGRAMRGGMRPTPRATCHDHGPRASWQVRGTLLAGCWLRRNAIPSLGPYRPRAVRSRASSSRRHGVDRSRRQGCATPGEPAYAKALLGHAARVIQRWPGNITHVEWLGGSESGSGNVCKQNSSGQRPGE